MSILKLLLSLGAVLNIANAVAQNTFPSSGNVGMGTMILSSDDEVTTHDDNLIEE
jgi:hypothetical protein